MGVITTGQTFSSGDQVTSTKLNDIANQATFTSAADTTDDSTLTISGGKLKVKDNGVGSTQLASDASTDTNRAVQTNHIRDDAVTQAKIADDAVGNDQLDDTAVTPGTYTNATVEVNQQGRVLAASSGTTPTSMTYSGAMAVASNNLSVTTSYQEWDLGPLVGENRAFVMIMLTAGSVATQFFAKPNDVTLNPVYGSDASSLGCSDVYLNTGSGVGGLITVVTDSAGAIQYKGTVGTSTAVAYTVLCYQVLA